MSQATRLIDAVGKGDPRAAEELLPLVYQEPRQLARSRMAQERSEHLREADEVHCRNICRKHRQADNRPRQGVARQE